MDDALLVPVIFATLVIMYYDNDPVKPTSHHPELAGVVMVFAVLAILVAAFAAGVATANWIEWRPKAVPVWFTRPVLRHLGVAAVLVLVTAFLIQISEPDFHLGSALAFGLLALLGLTAMFMFGLNTAGYDPDARRIADRLGVDGASKVLVHRWVSRVRYRRYVGGCAGLAAAAFSGHGGEWWLAGLCGTALGSLSAELHQCRPRPGPGRVASLTHRRTRDYVHPTSMILVGLAAAVYLVSLIWWFFDDSTATGALGWMMASLATLVLAALLVLRVSTRRRPALPPGLEGADDLIRRLSINNGITRPLLAVSLGLASMAWSVPAHAQSATTAIAPIFAAGAIIAWWGNRRAGLDYLTKDEPKPSHRLRLRQP